MHLPPILALLEHPGSSGFDDMLRLFGIAAIVFACFKGIHLLITKPTAPAAPAAPPQPAPASPPAPAPAPVPAGLPQPEVVAAAGIAPEIIAAIAAAVATVTGSTHRIVAIKHHSPDWGKAGRHSILTSHRIR